MKYFIGNWKMFGVPNSVSILNKINTFISRDKNRKKYKVSLLRLILLLAGVLYLMYYFNNIALTGMK